MRGGGNMQQMMKQMQKMQKKMAQQEKLKEERIVGTAGGGMVAVTVTGHKEVMTLKSKKKL
ncbi:YbaB/EbfC family nucleoid-associated protein [Staphylococcus aureus]